MWLFAKSLMVVAALEIALTVIGHISLVQHIGGSELRLGTFGSTPFAQPPLQFLVLGSARDRMLLAGWFLLTGIAVRKITRAPSPAVMLFVLCGFFFQSGVLLLGLVAMLLWKP